MGYCVDMRTEYTQHSCDCCDKKSESAPTKDLPLEWFPVYFDDRKLDICSLACAVSVLTEEEEKSPIIRLDFCTRSTGISRDYDD